MIFRKRRSHRSGRAPLPSPGRPPEAKRSELQQFWLGIARGMTSESAAFEAGISQPVGTRLFRKAGGMPPSMFRCSTRPPSGRYLSFAEREEIALLRVQGLSMRSIGRRLHRSASTISRELRRNAATRSGGLEYRASTAQWHAERSGQRPKIAKLALNPALRLYVEERLAGTVLAPDGIVVAAPTVPWIGRRHGQRKDRRWGKAWSPEQIAHRCALRRFTPARRTSRLLWGEMFRDYEDVLVPRDPSQGPMVGGLRGQVIRALRGHGAGDPKRDPLCRYLRRRRATIPGLGPRRHRADASGLDWSYA